MSITLRLANIDDLEILTYWDHKPHVLFATGQEEYKEDDWMENQLRNPSKFIWIYIAELDGGPIGVVQIIDPANEETHYWGDMDEGYRAIDIWIGEEENLGKGYGTIMMNLALANCFENELVKSVLIDPIVENKKAIRFYEKIGFEFVENGWFEEDYCSVYRIDRNKYFEIKNSI